MTTYRHFQLSPAALRELRDSGLWGGQLAPGTGTPAAQGHRQPKRIRHAVNPVANAFSAVAANAPLPVAAIVRRYARPAHAMRSALVTYWTALRQIYAKLPTWARRVAVTAFTGVVLLFMVKVALANENTFDGDGLALQAAQALDSTTTSAAEKKPVAEPGEAAPKAEATKLSEVVPPQPSVAVGERMKVVKADSKIKKTAEPKVAAPAKVKGAIPTTAKTAVPPAESPPLRPEVVSPSPIIAMDGAVGAPNPQASAERAPPATLDTTAPAPKPAFANEAGHAFSEQMFPWALTLLLLGALAATHARRLRRLVALRAKAANNQRAVIAPPAPRIAQPAALARAMPVQATPSWRFGVAGHQGHVRERMEDASCSLVLPNGVVIVIADGVGGEPEGRWAATSIVQLMRLALTMRGVVSESAIRDAFASSITTYSATCLAQGIQRGARSTLLVISAAKDTGFFGYLGDGAIFHRRGSDGAITSLMATHHNVDGHLTASVGPKVHGSAVFGSISMAIGDTLWCSSDGLSERAPDKAQTSAWLMAHIDDAKDTAEVEAGLTAALTKLVSQRDPDGNFFADDNATIGMIEAVDLTRKQATHANAFQGGTS